MEILTEEIQIKNTTLDKSEVPQTVLVLRHAVRFKPNLVCPDDGASLKRGS